MRPMRPSTSLPVLPVLPVLLAVLAGLVALPRSASAAERRSSHTAARTIASAVMPPTPAYADHPGAIAFAADVAARRDLPPAWVTAQLAQARLQPAAQRLVMPPPAGTAKNWAAYRDRFVEPRRIAAGVAFWRDNAARLAEAEARWGVPASIVVAIVGVETFYGRIMGSFRTIDALATLAFDFPSGRSDRSAFFRGELEELLVLAHRENVPATSFTGSFAGAIGLPQFMPGSINRHALDFDGDGRVDLRGSGADTVGSVAQYLASHGWQRGMATHHAVAVPVDVADRAALLLPDIVPSFTAAQFAERGAVLDAAGRAHAGLLALVMLENGDAAPTHVAGTQNFYAITRYNWSSYYALAVITLADAVAAARALGPN